MHSANVVHRDLKPSNLLVNKNCDLKVCDLGLGRGGIKEEDDEAADKKNQQANEGSELTEYVITRWYRAPEVILCPSEYSKAVDVWSIGCILAELLGRKPLFPGEHYLDQVQRIISVLGTPTSEDLEFITNTQAREFVMKISKHSKKKWDNLFPGASPLALDLLSKMLVFNPNKRITIEECIAHEYFEGRHDPDDEPLCKEPFDWSFDDIELTKENLQSMVYDESLAFHP